MIDSVNSLPMVQNSGIQNVLNTNPVQRRTVNSQISGVNINGANALASYNMPMVSKPASKNIQPLLPTVLLPEAIKAIKGERIYSSTGELDSIISKSENGTIVYKMDIQAPNDAISKIEAFDNEGRLIRRQENLNIIRQGQLPKISMIEILKFSPETGKEISGTLYNNGKPYSAWEKEYEPNGTVKEYAVNFKDNVSSVIETNTNQNISRKFDFDKNGNVRSILTKDAVKNSKETLKFKNGVLQGRSVETKTPIPNTTGKNPVSDPELVPAQPYLLGYDPKQIQGNKTYYSNGMLEAITTLTTDGGMVIHRFDINGNLNAIMDQKDINNPKIITFNPDSYIISERLSKDVEKLTVFNKDNSKEVSVVNHKNKSEKMIKYSKDGIPESYVDIDAVTGNKMLMDFDKQGNLISVY